MKQREGLRWIKERKNKKGKMKCKYCGKEIKRKWAKRYCNESCRTKHYYQKNKIKKRRYAKEYAKNLYNLYKCGNRKFHASKQCQKCYHSNKTKGQLSKLPSLK